jgi:hypothetical protein
MIDALARGGNRASAEEGFEPEHHPRAVLDQRPVGAGELLQVGAGGAIVIDRAQATAPQQLRQLVRVDLVTFVPWAGFPAPITHDDPIGKGREQVVQPLRLSPLLKRNVHRAAHPPEELRNRGALRRQYASRDHPPILLTH